MTNETNTTIPRRRRPLYRDTDDSMVAGVCSGLGHYFDMDTTLVRVALVVITVLGGAGLLAYIILWFALDPAPAGFYLESQTEPDIEQDETESEALPESQAQPTGLPDDVPSETAVDEPEITEP
ncbi:MAG: PspC domain-containing protein [Actinomycetia bacterium]|nr:PspC domain-containing protein [Actinomycetes bacterium]MCP4959500.1 PspC domain-containing protein [Actinomycetes bacterium]